MATVDKAFKIKNGLIVEGTTATVNGYDILTKNTDDQNYIIGLIGGSATSEATPDTVVLRDEFGGFSAGAITANRVNIGSVGYIEDDGSIEIVNTNGDDINLRADDIRLRATDDVVISAGYDGSAGGDVVLTTGGGVILLDSEDVYVGSGEIDSERVATKGYVDDSIGNIDLSFTSDEITEGTTNLYYTDARVDSHLSGGDGINYSTGTISADVAGGLHIDNAQVKIDRTTVDGWYDANGAAGDVASDLSTHEGLTSGVHGVTGSVVGTTDEQDLSNKRIIDTLYFSDGVTISEEGEIAVRAVSHDFDVQANNGDLNLKTVASGSDVNISSTYGDILLDPNGTAYYGSASAENEIATHGYVDNAVAGLDWKNAAHVLYNAATPTLSDTAPITIDGHLFTAAEDGLRVLVTSGNDGGSDAGIYVYSHGATWTLTRATDADAYTELLGAAIYIAEGIQFGGTSWVQNNPYLTDFSAQSWTQFSGAGSITAGSGITVDGLEVSVDRATVDTWYDPAGEATSVVGTHAGLTTTHGVTGDIVGTSDSQTLTNKTIDASDNTLSNIANSSLTNSSITVNGYSTDLGSSVTLDTDDVSEGTNQYFTTQRVKDVLTGSSQSNISITEISGVLTITAENGVDDSTTDDLQEGITNHYFTDDRAKDAAGYLLENSNQTNISITYDEVGRSLTVTAEDGFAGHDTDDLDEGTTNLYFTDARARDAVDGTTRSFTSININTYRTEEATQQVVPSASTVTAHTFTGNKSVKYLVRTVGSVTGVHHSQITELLATVDANDNVAVTEYGTIHTSENPLSTATVDFAGGDFRLRVTTNIASAEVIAAATIMSWAD